MKVSDVVELLLLAALWGASFLFMRIAAPVLNPVWLIEMRVLLAGLALLPVLIRLNLWHEVHQKLLPLFIVGCLNSALPFLLFAFASVSLSAGFTSILNATSPLFGTAIAAIWLGEKLTTSRMSGLVLGFAGVTVLVGMKTLETIPSSWTAIGAGLIAAFLYAVAAPYSKRQLSDVSPLVIATISQLSAAILLLPALPFTIPKTPPSLVVMLSIVALALFSTAIAYILYFRLIQHIGSTKALTVTYLIPVFAILWGKIFLQEPITFSMVLGCGLILLGTAIANNLFSDQQKTN